MDTKRKLYRQWRLKKYFRVQLVVLLFSSSLVGSFTAFATTSSPQVKSQKKPISVADARELFAELKKYYLKQSNPQQTDPQQYDELQINNLEPTGAGNYAAETEVGGTGVDTVREETQSTDEIKALWQEVRKIMLESGPPGAGPKREKNSLQEKAPTEKLDGDERLRDPSFVRH